MVWFIGVRVSPLIFVLVVVVMANLQALATLRYCWRRHASQTININIGIMSSRPSSMVMLMRMLFPISRFSSHLSFPSTKIENKHNPIRMPFTLQGDASLLLDAISSPHFPSEKEGESQGLPNRLVLIDGNSVMQRAYYKVMAKLQYGNIADVNGDADWVLTVFTALSLILTILELSPSHIAVVFDHEGMTFRHTMYAGYKKDYPTPDTVVQALQYIKPALLAMAIRTIEVPGVDASDVIGTLSVNAQNAGTKIRVVSLNKDFFQLVSPSLRLLRFMPRGSTIVSFGIKEFEERFGGLHPAQFVDVLALIGDKVDNIPGVLGIGEKYATKLITAFGSLENLMEQREQVTLKKAREGLLADNGDVVIFKKLVTIRTNLPDYMVPYTLDDLSFKIPEDGGEKYMNLLKAMGSYIDEGFAASLQSRTKSFWDLSRMKRMMDY